MVVYLIDLALKERFVRQQRTFDTVLEEESSWQSKNECFILEDGFSVFHFVVEAGTGVLVEVVKVRYAQREERTSVKVSALFLILDMSDPESG